MNFTEIAVRRPAALVIVVVLFIGLGIMGYSNLGADLLPASETPIITIVTTYPGAGVSSVEKDIIKPIENAVIGLAGLDTLRSGATVGYGYTIVRFKMGANINSAFMDVEKALGDVSKKLPKEADKPIIRKVDKNAEPVLMLSVSGAKSYDELYKFAEDIKSDIEKIQGVGNVTLEGAVKKQILVSLNKLKLEFYNVNVATVVGKLKVENISFPAGEIKEENLSRTIRLEGEFQDLNEIRNLLIPTSTGGQIRLGEIATVDFNYPEKQNLLRLSKADSIGIFVQKQSDANLIATVNKVKQNLEDIKKGFSSDVNIVVASDQSTYISSTLDEVQKNLIEGVITTALVLFLFLRRIRQSLIVLIAIPTSIISTFFMMYVFKFTLNIMSLMGLSVCIGILVDDSIVVLENIERHLRMGKNPIQAAIEGRKEIAMAAIVITLCDIVVFTPVAFMTDLVGQFFREFGLTVVFATVFSLLVSFTLTPMLASRLITKKDVEEEHKGTKEKKGIFKFVGRIFEYFIGRYKALLIWSLDNKLKIILIFIVMLVASISVIPLGMISTEFLPATDQSKINIDLKLSANATLKNTDEKVKLVEDYLKSVKEVKNFFSEIGIKEDKAAAQITVNLEGKRERTKSQAQLAKEIREWGENLAGVNFTVAELSMVGRTNMDGTKPVILKITGEDVNVLKSISKKIEDAIKLVPGVKDVENNSSSGKSEISLKIDRLALNEFGLTAYDTAVALRTLIQGTEAGVFRKNGDDYDIYVKFAEGQIKIKEDIGEIKISNSNGQLISLNQVAKLEMSDSPQELSRIDRKGLVMVSANIEGRALGSINKDIQKQLENIEKPKGYKVEFGGDQENMTTSFDSLSKVLVASILLVYMILVILYESFFTPMIRMLSLPCGIIGALIAMVVTGKTLSILPLLGVIMLDGLASKNGTLLIDYTNTLMKNKGLKLREAIIEAGVTRIRPILMTSITMIVGMLPVALALGDGSEIKSGMAVVLIGGMITSTMLTPILLPVVYLYMSEIKEKLGKNRKSKPKEELTV